MNLLSTLSLPYSSLPVAPRLQCLQNAEHFYLASGIHTVQVLSGYAWITVNSQDILLHPNETTTLRVQHTGLISGLKGNPLCFRVISAPSSAVPHSSTPWVTQLTQWIRNQVAG